MDNQEKILLIAVIVGVLLIGISLKYFPTTDLPKPVEQDGYCKTIYGSDWKFSEQNNNCYSRVNSSLVQTFTEEEFRNICPKVKFFELKFYSNCFHKGDSR
jgi:hypothetical protein